MPVVMTLDLPVPRDVIEAVTAEMHAHDNPPDGLIVHVVTDAPGGCQVLDLWESEEKMAAFRESRLNDAMGKVFADRGIQAPGPGPQPVFTPAYDLVRGR